MKKKLLFLAIMLLSMAGSMKAQVITIEGDQSQTTTYAPFYGYYRYCYTQMIYTADEVGAACDIYGIGFHAQTTTQQNRYVQIWLAPYAGTTLTSWKEILDSGAKLVYKGLYTSGSNDWSSVTFTSPFHHNTGEGVLVIVNDVTGAYLTSGYPHFYTNSTDRTLYAYRDDQPYVPYTITSSSPIPSATLRPDVKFYTTGPASISYKTVQAPFNEDFEGTPRGIDTLWPSVNDYNVYWMTDPVASIDDHLGSTENPTKFAKFHHISFQNRVGSLISPLVQTDDGVLRLSFKYICPQYVSDRDTLKVYYRTSTTGNWQLLMDTDGEAINSWTNATYDIFATSAQVKFEAHTGWGYGTGIDNVSITGIPLTVTIDGPDRGGIGNPLTFKAVGPEDATYTWTFTGATTPSATGQNVNVTYNAEGTYTIVLVAAYGSSVVTATKQVSIFDCSTVTEFPFVESFEDGLGCWEIIDADGDGHGWRLRSTSSYVSPSPHTGSEAIQSDSWLPSIGGVHPDNWIISRKIHLPSLTAQINWWEAAQSSNIGDIEDHYGLYVSTTGTNPEDFNLVWEGQPQECQTWVEHSMLLNPYCGQDVYIAFRHFNTYNEYALILDDIKVTGTVGIEDFEKAQLQVWPNPTNGLVHITSNELVKNVEVYNVQGALVKSVREENVIDLSGQSAGIYMLRITTESTTSVQRVVVR